MEMPPGTATDLFPAGGFVRLRACFSDVYIHADEDATGVSLRRLGAVPSLNAVWIADLCYVQGDASPYIQLQGAAYGRYLAVTNQRLPTQRGFGVLQSDDNSTNLDPWFVWRAYRADDGVLLRNFGGYLRRSEVTFTVHPSSSVVTADRSDGWRSQWEVVPIPPRPEAIPFPPPLPPLAPILSSEDPLDGLYPPPLRRTIRYARANDEGRADQEPDDWPDFIFEGRSVIYLWCRLVLELRFRMALFRHDLRMGITMCVMAGRNAMPLPLVTDLPLNEDPLNIIFCTNGSQAAAGLRYPQFDQPEA